MFAWFAFFKRNLREKLHVTSAKFFLDKKLEIFYGHIIKDLYEYDDGYL